MIIIPLSIFLLLLFTIFIYRCKLTAWDGLYHDFWERYCDALDIFIPYWLIDFNLSRIVSFTDSHCALVTSQMKYVKILCRISSILKVTLSLNQRFLGEVFQSTSFMTFREFLLQIGADLYYQIYVSLKFTTISMLSIFNSLLFPNFAQISWGCSSLSGNIRRWIWSKSKWKSQNAQLLLLNMKSKTLQVHPG